MSALALAALALLTHGGAIADPWGRPLATDFSSFWTAGKLALAGTPELAWDPAAHAAAQRDSFAAASGYAANYYAFFYPPPFLLICLPLGLLPYGAAVTAWLTLTAVAYVAVIRGLLPPKWPAILAALAFPAFLANAEHGQNGALSTALIGAAALQLDRRPGLAGACLGALCVKPQLALLVLPMLVAARRWQALAWTVAVALTLCGGSLLVVGEAGWRSFFANAALAQATLEDGLVGFGKIASAFAALRLLGAPSAAAWLGQGAASLAALIVAAGVAWRRPGAAAEGAALAAAACLATPFLLDYDLMVLAVPMAWVAARGEQSGYWPWEKLVLAGAFALPLVARSLAAQVGLPLAPLVVAALFWVVARRALGAPAGAVRPLRHIPTP